MEIHVPIYCGRSARGLVGSLSDDSLCCLFRVSSDTESSDSYLQLPVSVFVPAVLSSLAIIICCLSCCLRCCGCCNCCLATREHQSLLNPASATHQSHSKSFNWWSTHAERHVHFGGIIYSRLMLMYSGHPRMNKDLWHAINHMLHLPIASFGFPSLFQEA